MRKFESVMKSTEKVWKISVSHDVPRHFTAMRNMIQSASLFKVPNLVFQLVSKKHAFRTIQQI